MGINIVNLTPHALTLRNEEGVDQIIEKSGLLARVDETPSDLHHMEGLHVPFATPPVVGEVYCEDAETKERSCFPAPESGTIFLVSRAVAEVMKRNDVFRSGTGPGDHPIRNEKRHIVAVTRIVCAVDCVGS